MPSRNDLQTIGLTVLFGIAIQAVPCNIALAQSSTTASKIEAVEPLPNATPDNLPRWRGFNLLEKFHLEWENQPFVEDDFRMIQELGFNFVRLPMDYRVWIQDGDWNRFDPSVLKEIDQAVAWGKKYSLHVCLNFHRAPGYTVASPPEPTNLWTNQETQQVCARHWAEFARRYRGIPNRNLSFNLFNEPRKEVGDAYAPVVRKMVAAIRKEDPTRLIIADGMSWGRKPVLELADLKIAQATRGYEPHLITHYRADWMQDADQHPEPRWPRALANGTLYASHKSDVSSEDKVPMSITGPFRRDTRLRVRVGMVSSKTKLEVRADGKIIFHQTFNPGSGKSPWKETKHLAQWNVYQGVYDKDVTMVIPRQTRRVELKVPAGDWLTLTELAFERASGGEDTISLQSAYGHRAGQLTYQAGAPTPIRSRHMEDRQWLWDTAITPWIDARDHHGIGVVVGEFGCYRNTPHDITLAWMEDSLKNWKQAKFGWALWNFRGAFGILNSKRKDVDYEDYQGHKLDRKMLELLQRS